MALTKTQISYFQDRVRVIFRRVSDEIRNKFPIPEKMKNAEKIELIARGSAVLKYDELMEKAQLEDRFFGPYLLDSFELPGMCQNALDIKAAEKKREHAVFLAEKESQRICDDFVLGRIEDVSEVLDAFENNAQRFIDEALAS